LQVAQRCGELPGGVELSAESNVNNVSSHTLDGGATLRVVWAGVTSAAGELTADVNMSITLTAQGTASLSASVLVAGSNGSTEACVTAVSLPDLYRLILRDRRDKLFVPHFFGHEGDLADVCGGGDCTVSLSHDMVMQGEFGMMPNGNERAMQFMAAYSTRTSTDSRRNAFESKPNGTHHCSG
jgi:hypothetical protein